MTDRAVAWYLWILCGGSSLCLSMRGELPVAGRLHEDKDFCPRARDTEGEYHMRPIVTCKEMKALDAAAIHQMGIPSLVLMERAALKTAEEMERFFVEAPARGEHILVVCGSGNNGGDGIAIARLLHLHGFCTEIYLAGYAGHMTEETSRQLKIAENYGVPVVNNPVWDEYTTIVDAIFGVGLGRPVEGKYADTILGMNASPAWKVAVDIPSGIDGDTGRVLGTAFRADLTVTYAFQKRGLCFYPGRRYAGEIVVADIGIYEMPSLPVSARHLEKSDLSAMPRRDPGGNKGTFGKVLVEAGSPGMCGAAYLCASAALRGGAGMVLVHTVEENRIPLQILLPEAMVSCDFCPEENERLLNWCDVLVIGPGLGQSGESAKRAEWFLSGASGRGKSVILDADGLNLLAVHKEWTQWLGDRVILTPHPGEMGRLCKKTIEEIQADPAGTAAAFAERTGAVCVLKDACTVTASPFGELYLNLAGNAGMATAGSGDVLSGILAAVCCRYLPVLSEADFGKLAASGVYLHALSGDLAAERSGMIGMTAGDIVRMLPDTIQAVHGGTYEKI